MGSREGKAKQNWVVRKVTASDGNGRNGTGKSEATEKRKRS